MGKAKKRNFTRITNVLETSLKRDKAVNKVLKNIKSGKNMEDNEKLISYFGITIEELLEAGATYEEISAIKYIFI